ncbi:leucine-rich repeat-containing protein let-4 [Ixodes scapularis]
MAIFPSVSFWIAAAIMAAQVTGLNSSKLLAADCPQLSHCVCGQYARYIRIYCSTHVNFSLNFGDISSDLVKLPGLKIKKLIINRVNETVLPPNFLANLTITNLVINDDRLEFIADEAFVGVLKLTKLIVLTTQLKSVPHAVSFLGPKLINLEMTNNRIEKVDDVLNKLINLEILNLENNRIVSLDDNLFANLIQLRELRLGNNMIEHLPTSLSRAKHLVFMDLHNNNIKVLGSVLRGLRQLRDLHVYGNNISDVTTIFTREKDFFNDLRLRFVNASRNNITSVEGAFRTLDGVRTVSLLSNRLTAVHRKSFPDSVSKEMKISLEGNPIFCDCQILWLLVSTVHTTKSNESVCNGPAWLQGRSLYNLTTDEVTTWYADCDERCTSPSSNLAKEQKAALEGETERKAPLSSFEFRRDEDSSWNFVDSEWCRWEFRVAHHRALEDRINRLIIVVVDEVTPEALDEELHLYMQATSYLRWGEHKFWDKLIYSLPKKDARQRLILSALDTQQTFVSEEQLEHPLTSQMELSTEV